MPEKSEGITSSELLSVLETAELLRISQGTVRAWVLARKIPYIKLGSRVLFCRAELEAFIQRSTVSAREGA